MKVLCAFLWLYTIVFWARAILSWFPVRSGPMVQVQQVLHDLTEPVLAPVRRVIPPAGMFDISFLIVAFLLSLITQSVCVRV